VLLYNHKWARTTSDSDCHGASALLLLASGPYLSSSMLELLVPNTSHVSGFQVFGHEITAPGPVNRLSEVTAALTLRLFSNSPELVNLIFVVFSLLIFVVFLRS
jgi:hypothetical protein